MQQRWKNIRHRFEWLVLWVLAAVLPRLPRRVVVEFSRVLGRMFFIFDRYGRKVTLANLTAAFGEKFTLAQRKEIAQAVYCGLSRTMCDLFWSPALSLQNFQRYIKVENVEVLQRLQARGEGAVLVCLHQGNFEWASLATGFHGASATIVAKQFKNPLVGGFLKRCREVSGHRIIPQERSMIRLLKHVRQGGMAGMLADLNRRPSEAATVIEAFGMKMCVSLLHAVLVQRGSARLVPVEGRSEPDGSCRVIYHEPLTLAPDASLQQIAQACWDSFEPALRARPQDWMWNYRHWRYKPTGDTHVYPFYAKENSEFDQLVSKETNALINHSNNRAEAPGGLGAQLPTASQTH